MYKQYPVNPPINAIIKALFVIPIITAAPIAPPGIFIAFLKPKDRERIQVIIKPNNTHSMNI